MRRARALLPIVRVGERAYVDVGGAAAVRAPAPDVRTRSRAISALEGGAGGGLAAETQAQAPVAPVAPVAPAAGPHPGCAPPPRAWSSARDRPSWHCCARAGPSPHP